MQHADGTFVGIDFNEFVQQKLARNLHTLAAADRCTPHRCATLSSRQHHSTVHNTQTTQRMFVLHRCSRIGAGGTEETHERIDQLYTLKQTTSALHQRPFTEHENGVIVQVMQRVQLLSGVREVIVVRRSVFKEVFEI